jgi:hypothetical protein
MCEGRVVVKGGKTLLTQFASGVDRIAPLLSSLTNRVGFSKRGMESKRGQGPLGLERDLDLNCSADGVETACIDGIQVSQAIFGIPSKTACVGGW